MRKAEKAFPPIGEFIQVEDIQLHYLDRGTGQPVVLLHGNAGFIQDYFPQTVDQLAPHFRAIAFDRPGHGYSTRSSDTVTTPLDQARLLHSAFQQLGIEQPILVGHSWSGIVLLAYALEYPKTSVASCYWLQLVSFVGREQIRYWKKLPRFQY